MKSQCNLGFQGINENREGWLDYRKGKIGSSEIATIVGLNKYKSPLELWCERTGKTDLQDFTNNPHIRRGVIFENPVRELFALTYPCFKVQPVNATYELAGKEWAIASPDSEILPIGEIPKEFEIYQGETGGQEIKVTRSYSGWEDGAPDYAHIQLMWQIGIKAYQFGFVSGFVCGEEINKFYRFDEGIFNTLLEAAEQFLDYIKKDIPPNAGAGDADLIKKLVKIEEGQIDFPEDSFQLYEQFKEASKMKADLTKEIKFWEEKQKTAKNSLIMLLGAKKANQALLPNGEILSLKQTVIPDKQVAGYSFFDLRIKKGK